MMTKTVAYPARPRATDASSTANGEKQSLSIWQWLRWGVHAGLLSLILGIAVIAIALPRLAGAVPLTVLSSSMEPALPPGTMLVVRPLAQDQLDQIRIGDVISYQPYPNDPTLITHRVTNVMSLQRGGFVFTTKGDANGEVDPPVHDYQVRARLWYSIPGLGWVNDLVNARGNRAWIVPATAGVLFAYSAYTLVWSVTTTIKKRRAGEAAATASAEP